LTHDIFSSQKFGGISRYFAEMFQAFPAMPNWPEEKLFAGCYISGCLGSVQKNMTGFRVPNFPHSRFLRHRINEKWQSREIESWKPDLLHVTYPFRDPAAYKVPFVITVHDMVPELHPDSFANAAEITAMKRKYCELATGIIVVSEATKKQLLRLFDLPAEKVMMVHHGVNAVAVPAQKQEVQRPFILYVGSHEKYKNFANLCLAMNASPTLKDFDLIAFGTQDPRDLPHSSDAAAALGNRLIIKHGGDDELRQLYLSAQALVYPSLEEGFGMPLLEAMAAGCPVICSNTAALVETGGDAARYFSPVDAGSIASVLKATLFSETTLAELRAAGLQRSKMFSWKDCAKKTADFYNSQ